MAGVAASLAFAAGMFAVIGVRRLLVRPRGSRVNRLMGLPVAGTDREPQPGWLDRLQAEALQAGLTVTASQLVLIAVTGGALGYIAIWVVTGRVDLAFFGGLLALYAPRWWIARSVGSRARLFALQLEDILDRMSTMLRAGVGILPALERAADEAPGLVGAELRAVANQARVMPLVQALERACQRVKSPELEMVAMAVAVTQEYGGDLAGVLDRLVEGMRSRRNFRDKVAALTADTRMSANLMVGLTFGVLAMIRFTTPEFTAPLFGTRQGLAVLGAACIAIGVGWKIMSSMGEIKLE